MCMTVRPVLCILRHPLVLGSNVVQGSGAACDCQIAALLQEWQHGRGVQQPVLMRAEHHAVATFALAMLMLVVAAAGTMTMGTKPRTVLDHVHHTDVHQISLFVLMSTS